MKLIHAHEKPRDELPAWSSCCRALMEADLGVGLREVLLDPTIKVGAVTCQFCGAVQKNVKFMVVRKVIAGKFSTSGPHAIIVDCFEFDEGFVEL
jgi:hypothetical protein